MSNETKKTALPKLRFPEFREAGEWEALTLKEISDPITEKVGKLVLPPVSISAGTGFVLQADKFGRDISGAQYKNYTLLRKGDISYNKGNSKTFPQGCVYQLKEFEQVAAPNVFISFRFKKGFVAGFYKGYFDNNFHGEQLQNFITSGARSNGLLNISSKSFFSITLPTPVDIAEQQKIAAALSSLDDLLTAQSAQLAALQAHKRGLMQGLFPAEGETVPKLRFPEFQQAPEWEEKTLGDILIEARLGSNFQSTDVNCGFPVIKMANLGRGRISLDKVEYLEENATYGDADLLQAGDLLFNTRNTLDLVGKVAIWNNELPQAVYNTNLLRLAFNQKIVSTNYFMNYLFNTNEVLGKLRSIATGTTSVAAIYGKDLNQIVLTIPELAEQQKIADCLTSLDNRISAQTQKIEALKLHKKGLMQGLFPAAAEPTA